MEPIYKIHPGKLLSSLLFFALIITGCKKNAEVPAGVTNANTVNVHTSDATAIVYPIIAIKSTIIVTETLSLPVMIVPTIGASGTKSNTSVYPLKVSTTDTLFFSSQSQSDFVKNGLVTAGVKSITKVLLGANTIVPGRINYVDYGGRPYNYYYFCNAFNYGYFNVAALTSKLNSTFNFSYNSSNSIYTVFRNQNNIANIEAYTNYQPLANCLAGLLTGFNCTQYLKEGTINVGYFYFFLSLPVAPVITAGGPTTLYTGGSVTLSSSAPSGNTWYNGIAAIAGATATTYKAITSGSYTVKTTAPGFNNSSSNAIKVTVVNTLTVSGKKLLNNSGSPVILRGVNSASYKSGWANDLQAVSNSIKNSSKVNSVRLMWNSTQFVTATYGANAPPYFTLPNLDAELSAYTNLHILPVLCLHDLTDIGDNSTAGFNHWVVGFWTDPNLITILKKYQNNLIINLQNEWGATWAGLTGSAYVSTYQALIVKLRNLGINCPIMIDAPDGGANSSFIITNGQALINADPIKNVLLSVHTYWSQENGAIINCPADYVSKIKAIANSNLPFVLGEVSDWAVRGADGQDIPSTPPVSFICPGTGSANKYAVNYDAILTEACNDSMSFFAWSWYQDGNMVRNIYNQDTGTTINISPNAGTWPADMTNGIKIYNLNSASVVPVF